MSCTQGIYEIIDKQQISENGYSFIIKCNEVADMAIAGQFVHVKCGGFMLRRPISISSINKKERTITIIFEVRGDGTKWLSTKNINDTIDIIAPLGNGFDLIDKNSKVILIGGGIGTPPMLALAEYYGENSTVITGFRNKSAVILQDEFENTKATVLLATDDGSAGKKGFVTDLLKQQITNQGVDIIYACGPTPMLKAVAQIAQQNKIRCQISLEERMGCGVGACLVCVCKIKESNGDIANKCVCKTGPVFESLEVVFDA